MGYLIPLVLVIAWLFIFAPKFPRADALVGKVLYFMIPLIALIGTVSAWLNGGYRVLWAMALGALIVTRFEDFMEWKYQGISPFKTEARK